MCVEIFDYFVDRCVFNLIFFFLVEVFDLGGVWMYPNWYLDRMDSICQMEGNRDNHALFFFHIWKACLDPKFLILYMGMWDGENVHSGHIIISCVFGCPLQSPFHFYTFGFSGWNSCECSWNDMWLGFMWMWKSQLVVRIFAFIAYFWSIRRTQHPIYKMMIKWWCGGYFWAGFFCNWRGGLFWEAWEMDFTLGRPFCYKLWINLFLIRIVTNQRHLACQRGSYVQCETPNVCTLQRICGFRINASF